MPLCRDCKYDSELCGEWGHPKDPAARKHFCAIPSYENRLYTPNDIFCILSFRCYLSICNYWFFIDDGDWPLAYWIICLREQYKSLLEPLLQEPRVDTVHKINTLYAFLDTTCKDEDFPQFFYHGLVKIPHKNSRRFTPTYRQDIMKDWELYGKRILKAYYHAISLRIVGKNPIRKPLEK